MNHAPARPLPTFWWLQLLGWGSFHVAMSFSRLGRYPLAFMLVEKTLLTTLGVGASLVLRALLKPRIAAQQSMPALVVTSVVASYLVATIWTALFNIGALPVEQLFLGRRDHLDSIGALLNGSVYHAFALVAWSFLYIGIKHHFALLDERERALRAEASAATAQLRALKYQLNPHLFFNTLNAISTLLVERRNDDAALMIARLGDFMRTILQQDAVAQVSLADDLALAGRYLDIEQIRFGDGLVVTYDVDEDAYRGLVPLLLLQPLVENAIKHGVARNDGRGTIALSARRHDERLDISIVNGAPPHESMASVENGVGLTNIRERLSVLHGDKQSVRASRAADGRFTVEIGLPFVPQLAP